MAATRSTSTFLGSIFRTASARSLISPRPRLSAPNPSSRFNASPLRPRLSAPNPSSRFNASPLRQTRIEGSAPRLLRRELSTHQPFHSVVACACLVSKLPSDVTSYDGRFANYLSPI